MNSMMNTTIPSANVASATTTPVVHTTRLAVRRFIIENFFVAEESALRDDTSLLDHGIVDSTGVLEVTAFLESTFDIRVEDAEIVPANLDSIASIAAFVTKKRS